MASIAGMVKAVLERIEYCWVISHLKSLEANAHLRPAQVAIASRLSLSLSICGGFLMGYSMLFSVLTPHHQCEMIKNAYLEAGRIEGNEEGCGE